MQNQFIFDVNEQNIQQILQESSNVPVMFYFWSERSPHCKELSPILNKIATEKQGQFILAKLDCDDQAMLAGQFGLRAIPTVYLFKDGQPVDGFQGPQSEEQINALLAKVLPNEDEIALKNALPLLEQGNYKEALPLLKKAYQGLKDHHGNPRSDIALQVIKAQIELKQLDDAKALLATIPLQDQDSTYHGLVAEIELLEQAANSPEILQLEDDLKKDPNNIDLIIKLASQLMQVGRQEEALDLVFSPLQKDLNAGDGALKKALLDMLAALGTSHQLAAAYRRKLYTLLY